MHSALQDSVRALCLATAAGCLAAVGEAHAAAPTWQCSAQSPPSVVVEGPPSEPLEFAASELARYLGQVLGKPVDVGKRVAGRPTILVQKVQSSDLGDEGFEVTAEGNTLRLRAGGDLGAVYAAYEVLRRYAGCRFSGLGPDGEYIPLRRAITAEGLPLRMTPKLWYRGPQLSAQGRGHRTEAENTALSIQWIDWLAKNGYNYVMYTPAQDPDEWFERHIAPEMRKRGLKLDIGHHNFRFWLSPREHFAAHPEWFPMVNGQRIPNGNQLSFCTSNAEAVQTLIANVKRFLRAHPEVSIVGVIPEDGWGLCHCEACTQLDVANGMDPQEQYRSGGNFRTEGRGNRAKTRRYTLLINQVARAIREEFPHVRVGSAAYIDLTWPDPEIPLEPNVVTWVAMYWRDGCRPLAEDSPAEVNRVFFDALKQWRRMHRGKVITYSYYMGMNAQAALPYPQDQVILREWRNLRALGVEGATLQNWPGNHEVYALNLLAFGRAAWHDQVDPDALLEEYLQGMYGAAASEIRPLFDAFHEAWRRAEEEGAGQWSTFLSDPKTWKTSRGTVVLPNGRSIVFLLDVLGEERLDECLRRAREKAATDRERRQVDRLVQAADYWKKAAALFRLEAEAAQAATAGDPARANELKARIVRQCDELLTFIKHLPPGYLASSTPRVWEGLRSRYAAK